MFRLLTGQIRNRWSLLPGVSKGWNPNQAKSVGHAMEFAMASKRMKMSWLAQGTRIPIDRLKSAVRSGISLTEQEIRRIEMYLGVSIKYVQRSGARKCPP
jgi:hypothetical protein